MPTLLRTAILSTAGTLLFSQTPPEPVIKVSVDLVQIDAVVTDAQGRHIGDLKPEDFQVLEDGKPQKITHFSYVQGQPNPLHPAQMTGGAKLAFTEPLRPQDVRRTIVLVADDLGFGPAEFPRVRSALKDFIDTQMQPGDLVSIMTTSGGMGALEHLTNDKRSLYAAIARIAFSPSRNAFGGSILSQNPNGPHYDFETDDRALAASRVPLFAAGSTSALGYAIQALRDMPGRKAVAVFSAGFAGSTPGLIEMANRSAVVIYTFDMRGIIATWDAHLPPGFWASQGSMDVLARGTGGIFFHETNAFAAALKTALDDMSSYYLIGYQPQHADFDLVRGATQFHKIQVKVLRAGLNVRSRDGFAGVPDAVEVSKTDAGAELRAALDSPFLQDSLPVYLSAFYSGSSDRKRIQTTLRTVMAIDARGLKPADIAGGKQRMVFDVLAGIWGESDKPIATVDRKFTIEKTPDEMERAIASGLAIEVDLPVPRPGAYQLRSAVRDGDSGQTGSATSFVEIPDFNARRLALSSVLLSPDSVSRAFRPGAVLDYDCQIFGAQQDKNSHRPKIDLEVHLFRGPEHIFTGHPIAVPVTTSEPPVRATGQIRLPDFLPSGGYAIELIAYDRVARNKQHATQWVDFKLVR